MEEAGAAVKFRGDGNHVLWNSNDDDHHSDILSGTLEGIAMTSFKKGFLFGTLFVASLFMLDAVALEFIPTAPQVSVTPAVSVEINQLTAVPYPPPLFGAVLRVKTAEGYTRMSIQGDGSIRFEHGATLMFDDLVYGEDGRLFVPVWVKGSLLLLEVHAPSAAVRGKLSTE
jgi:hypothetical protein